MFWKHLNGIVVVHDDEVLWIKGRQPDAGSCVLRLPLEQVLAGDDSLCQIPKDIKGNYKSLCIVPDH